MVKRIRVATIRESGSARKRIAYLALASVALGSLSISGCAVVPHDPGQAYPVGAQGTQVAPPAYPSGPTYAPPAYGYQGYDAGAYYGAGPVYFPPSVYYAPPIIVAPPIVLRSPAIIAPHFAYGVGRPNVIGPAPVIVPPRVIAPSQGIAQVVQTRPHYGGGFTHTPSTGNAPPAVSSPRYQAPPSAPIQGFHHGGGQFAGGHHSGVSSSIPSFRSGPSVGASPRYGSGGASSRRSR
jgi:hypothetical protein